MSDYFAAKPEHRCYLKCGIIRSEDTTQWCWDSQDLQDLKDVRTFLTPNSGGSGAPLFIYLLPFPTYQMLCNLQPYPDSQFPTWIYFHTPVSPLDSNFARVRARCPDHNSCSIELCAYPTTDAERRLDWGEEVDSLIVTKPDSKEKWGSSTRHCFYHNPPTIILPTYHPPNFSLSYFQPKMVN